MPVLVVEDNSADFRLLQDAVSQVRSFELELTRVDRLHSAILKLQAHRFEAVILDLALPDADGLEGVRRLQELAPELPIVVLTNKNDLELALCAVREGAQDYLVKGQVDGPLLIRAVRYATERMRYIQETKRSEERFRCLLENAIDIITVIDSEGNILYASRSIDRVLGYDPDELVGVSAASLVHPADRRRAIEGLKPPRSGTPCTIQFRIQHRDGRWRVLEGFAKSVMQDPVSGVIVNARDVTDRNEPEQRQRAAEDRLQAVIETSPLAIFVLDLTGCVLGWNKAAEKTFGWTEAEILGRELPTVRAQGQAEFHARLLRVRSGQPFGEIEARYAHKDGSNIDVNIWTSPLRDETSLVTGLVCMVADVTERRRLEEQLRHSQKMEAVGRLAGGVAHDFNNLLTVITGYSQLASSRLAADSQESSHVQEVLLAAARAANLTKQLLALSRRTVGEPAILDLNSVINEMKGMFERIIGEDIVISAQLSSSLKLIRADRDQIEMVFLNLIVNARDAMPGGGHVFIETANVDASSDPMSAHSNRPIVSGSCVVLSISDTGIGMDEQVRSRLFEPFFTTKEPGKGTGLGLSTSYGIIRQHSGDIQVYSEPGVGSTFRVYLPAAEANATPEVITRTPPPPGGTETILIIEDDPSVASVMRDALQMRGYRVLLTGSPKQALDVVREDNSPIHLVLSHMVLRTMHGVDLMRQIRTVRSGVRVLYISGYTAASMPGRHCLEPGSAFLQKPFGPDTLVAKVREVLNEA